MAEYKWNCSHCHNTHYGEDNLDGPRREGSVLTCTICREESEIVDYDVVYEYRTATKLPISVEFARGEVATRIREKEDEYVHGYSGMEEKDE